MIWSIRSAASVRCAATVRFPPYSGCCRDCSTAFPTLQIFFAENQIGWIPFFLQGADVRYDRHHRWAERLAGIQTAQAAAERIYPRALSVGFSIRPRRRRAAPQDRRRQTDVGLRLPAPRIRLARLAQDHREKLRRRAGSRKTQNGLRQRRGVFPSANFVRPLAGVERSFPPRRTRRARSLES